jgi:TonB family protein
MKKKKGKRPRRKIDPLVWAFLASAALIGTFMFLVLSIPPAPESLALELFEANNRFVKMLIKPPERRDDLPDWLKKAGPDGTGQRHAGEIGLYGLKGPRDGMDPHLAKRMAEDEARDAGVLGLLKSAEGGHSASIFGRDTSLGTDTRDLLGNLIGGPVGQAYGATGLGLVGTGKSEGQIGKGAGGARGAKGRSPASRGSGATNDSVRGALDKEIIRRIVRRHLNEIRYCHQRHGGDGGRTTVQFTIAPTGQVVASNVAKSTTGSRAVDRCVARAVGRWLFPKPKGGGIVVVSYPFVFRSAGPESPARAPAERKKGAERRRVAGPARPKVWRRLAPTPLTADARAFWEERDRTDLPPSRFRAPTGYWENTYVPGDPEIRLLQARLSTFDRSRLAHASGTPKLDDAARPYRQSFDPPRGAALSLHLHADRRAVRGPARALVQVGLQGTSRYGGRRPEMNIAVVLDWRGSHSAQVDASIRALLFALDRARDVGDRFTLTVAGFPGGLTVPASDFRRGPLTVALQKLTGAARGDREKASSLTEALARATARFNPDDPAAPLSSNMVLLVTSGALDPRLKHIVHEKAVAGIPTSVVGVGPGVDGEQLNRLAVAGHGNRRLLAKPARAADLVDRELSAAASVVARALRLHIRLAPGVKLVDVLGSRPLGEVEAQKVREAEQSIDLRVAQNLGVTADRGEDDEGIQIVIPAYYAGDAHVVLLDVVVPGPGPVVDVTVRYKDLVYLRNGSARAHLGLARGSGRRGPLQMGVLKNLLSYRTSLELKKAGKLLAQRDGAGAGATLAAWRRLLSSLRAGVPDLARDGDIARDLAMLDEYRAVLRRAGDGEREHLASSLKVAGHLKVVPRRVNRRVKEPR